MSTELTVKEQSSVDFYSLPPNNKVHFATAIAKELSRIIDDQKMYTKIGATKHVKVEGWTTALALLGIIPREKSVVRHADGSYEASVELVNFSNGLVVGGGSALCGMDETTWANRPEYARRSMSITRATGKSARLAFSWIIQLAGFSPTPAEEMPETEPEKTTQPVTEELYVQSNDQQARLEIWLSKTKLEKSRWPEFEDKLMNRPVSDCKKILKEMTAQ